MHHFFNAQFGLDVTGTDQTALDRFYLDILLDVQGEFSSVEAQIILRRAYLKKFRIYDPDVATEEQPYPLVRLHPHLDPKRTRTRLSELCQRFKDAEVGKHFNLSLKELMEMPAYESEQILASAERFQAKEDERATAEHDEFERKLNQSQ